MHTRQNGRVERGREKRDSVCSWLSLSLCLMLRFMLMDVARRGFCVFFFFFFIDERCVSERGFRKFFRT